MADLIELGGGFTAERRNYGDFAISHKDGSLHMAGLAEVAMVEEIERLRAELEECRLDAERYAFLSDNWGRVISRTAWDGVDMARTVEAIELGPATLASVDRESLDAAIDAALAAQEQK